MMSFMEKYLPHCIALIVIVIAVISGIQHSGILDDPDGAKEAKEIADAIYGVSKMDHATREEMWNKPGREVSVRVMDGVGGGTCVIATHEKGGTARTGRC